MKALKLLIAPLILSSVNIFAQDSNLDEYISKNKQEYFLLEEQKVDSSSDVLRDSWISPVMLNYSYGISEAYNAQSITKKTSISIDQPIFQSGGIYYGIKYAEANRIYSKYSVDVAKRKVIKDAISLLMQIKQSDIRAQKQNYMIKNAEIDLAQKKEAYLNGQLDSGFLNSAIIDRNIVIQALYDIEANKEKLVSKLRAISDADHKSVTLPHLKLIDEDEFLKNNIVYKQSKSFSEKARYSKNTTITQYLPKLSIYAGYNWDETENLNFGGTLAGDKKTDYATYGFKASMPLNINALDDIETSRVEYLESKIVEADKKRELKAIFEQVMQNIENFEKKKLLSVENKDLYATLLDETKTLYEAGYKTEYDVEMMQNSLEVQKMDIEIYEIDKELELLTLYEMYVNEI
ncbi:MAG: hypothetical protein QG559_331 [Campylobacterota bacterium]|nr:hypothetical protein [Campylobacterota bacterium]